VPLGEAVLCDASARVENRSLEDCSEIALLVQRPTGRGLLASTSLGRAVGSVRRVGRQALADGFNPGKV
jgi:hypothetical protein